MPDQITSHENRLNAVLEKSEEHKDCTHPAGRGVWHDYGSAILCTRCGEEKLDKPQPRPAPVKAVAQRRRTK